MSEDKTPLPRIFSVQNMLVAMNHASPKEELQRVIDLLEPYNYYTELTYEDMAVVIALSLNAGLTPPQLREVAQKLPDYLKQNAGLDLVRLEDLNFKLPEYDHSKALRLPDDFQNAMQASWSVVWALASTHRQAVTALLAKMPRDTHVHPDDLLQLPAAFAKMGYDLEEYKDILTSARKRVARAILEDPDAGYNRVTGAPDRLVFCARELNEMLVKGNPAVSDEIGYLLLERVAYRIRDIPALAVLRPGLRALLARVAGNGRAMSRRRPINYYRLIELIGDRDDIFNLAVRLASEPLKKEEEADAIQALTTLRKRAKLEKKTQKKAGIKEVKESTCPRTPDTTPVAVDTSPPAPNTPS